MEVDDVGTIIALVKAGVAGHNPPANTGRMFPVRLCYRRSATLVGRGVLLYREALRPKHNHSWTLFSARINQQAE